MGLRECFLLPRCPRPPLTPSFDDGEQRVRTERLLPSAPSTDTGHGISDRGEKRKERSLSTTRRKACTSTRGTYLSTQYPPCHAWPKLLQRTRDQTSARRSRLLLEQDQVPRATDRDKTSSRDPLPTKTSLLSKLLRHLSLVPTAWPENVIPAVDTHGIWI